MDHRLSETQAAAVAAAFELALRENMDAYATSFNGAVEGMTTYWLEKIDEMLTAPEVSGD